MPEVILPVSAITPNGTVDIKEMSVKAANYDEYCDKMSKMDLIEREMRETPAPVSEVLEGQPTNRILRVEFPPQGGTLTFMEGFDQPYQGFPLHPLVERMDLVKKITKNMKSGFYHRMWKKTNWITKWPLILISYPFMRIYAKNEIYACWRHLERFRVKPRMYCRSVREIYRAFSLPVSENERYKSILLREQMRDILCMHLEFDNAYRFRFQDVIAELDRDKFKKNPVKEIMRLFNVMSEREIRQEVKDAWTLTKWMIEYLRFSKEIKPILISVINNLNLPECELKEMDYPYCIEREDYKFNNKNFKQTKIKV